MKLKALAAIAVAGIMVMSVPMVAMAGKELPLSDDGAAQTYGTVTGKDTGSNTAINFYGGSTVTVDGDVSCNSTAISTWANDNNNIIVNGNVSTTADCTGICNQGGSVHITGNATGQSNNNSVVNSNGTSYKSTTKIDGDVTNEGSGKAIEAKDGATVTAGSATNNSNSKATVQANESDANNSNTTIIVNGAVTNHGDGSAIEAYEGATVKAGSATNAASNPSNDHPTIQASDSGTAVTITNDVTKSGNGIAIRALDDATVTVGGDVTTAGTAGITGTDVYIDNSDGSTTTVTVFGDLKGDTGICINDIYKDNYDVNVYKIDATHKIVDNNEKDASGNQTVISNIHYIIKNASTVGDFELTKGTSTGTVGEVTDLSGKTYQTATAAYGYKVTIKEVDGYTFKSIACNTSSLLTDNGDGTYTLLVPTGGGVSLELVYEAIQKAQEASFSFNPTILGSEESPITGGTWAINNGSWTYKYNGSNLVNTLAWIKTDKPDGTSITNRYYFDKNGNMATGWQKTGDKWFYFNTESGEMLTGNIVENGKTYHIDKENGWDKTKDVSGAYWTLDGKLVKEEEKEEKYWYI